MAMFALAGAVNGYSMQSAGGAFRIGRAALSKLASPRMDITLDKAGEFGTTDFTMTFKKVPADLASRSLACAAPQRSPHLSCAGCAQDGKTISPWHDIPLEAGNGLYNFVAEIPKMTLKKMEVRPRTAAQPHKPTADVPTWWGCGSCPQCTPP